MLTNIIITIICWLALLCLISIIIWIFAYRIIENKFYANSCRTCKYPKIAEKLRKNQKFECTCQVVDISQHQNMLICKDHHVFHIAKDCKQHKYLLEG